MEFLERMLERERFNRFRIFDRMLINNNVSISIQASYGLYCSPRETLDNLKDYSSMEMAIFKNGEFVNVNQVTNNIDLINRLNECYDGTVYGYVPVTLIEELFQDLNSQTTIK